MDGIIRVLNRLQTIGPIVVAIFVAYSSYRALRKISKEVSASEEVERQKKKDLFQRLGSILVVGVVGVVFFLCLPWIFELIYRLTTRIKPCY